MSKCASFPEISLSLSLSMIIFLINFCLMRLSLQKDCKEAIYLGSRHRISFSEVV